MPNNKSASARSAKGERDNNLEASYPFLERLLDQDKPDFSKMQARYHELQDMVQHSKSAKDKAAAKQAAVAYERFFELIKYLLDVKLQLQTKSEKKSK